MIVPSQSPVAPTNAARSKVELLYRDLCIEYERLQGINQNLADQLRETSATMASVPPLIRSAAASVSTEASAQAHRELHQAAQNVRAAEAALSNAGRALEAMAGRSIRLCCVVALLSALIGGLLGTLIGTFILS